MNRIDAMKMIKDSLPNFYGEEFILVPYEEFEIPNDDIILKSDLVVSSNIDELLKNKLNNLDAVEVIDKDVIVIKRGGLEKIFNSGELELMIYYYSNSNESFPKYKRFEIVKVEKRKFFPDKSSFLDNTKHKFASIRLHSILLRNKKICLDSPISFMNFFSKDEKIGLHVQVLNRGEIITIFISVKDFLRYAIFSKEDFI